MGVKVRCTRVALNTSTGNQDITISGLGSASEIKAAMFIVSNATADATDTDHAKISIGFTDGTNHRVVGNHSRHAQASTDILKIGTTDEVIQIIADDGSGVDIEANFVSFITDGVQINIGNEGAALLCTVILWVGTDVNAEVGDFLPNITVDLTTVVTAGFEFDHMIAVGLFNNTTFDDLSDDTFAPNLGLCSNDGGGSFTQGCVTTSEAHNSPAGSPSSKMRSNRVMAQVAGGGEAGAWEVTAATSSNFTITTRNATTQAITGYLIISYGGAVNHWVDNDQSSPTASGDRDTTDVGFQPQFVMHGLSMFDTADQVEDDFQAGSFGIGVFDEDNEFTTSIAIEDDAATMNTQSRSDAKAAFLRLDDGSNTEFDGTFQSFLSNGYRINYAASPNSTVRHWIALAVESDVAYEQEGHHFRDDDGSESAATFLGAQDSNITRPKSTNTRLRITTDSTSGDPPTAQVALQYRQTGDADSEWRDVPT